MEQESGNEDKHPLNELLAESFPGNLLVELEKGQQKGEERNGQYRK
jgi:hypothetical protein